MLEVCFLTRATSDDEVLINMESQANEVQSILTSVVNVRI